MLEHLLHPGEQHIETLPGRFLAKGLGEVTLDASIDLPPWVRTFHFVILLASTGIFFVSSLRCTFAAAQ